jgi:Pentapeptide repeats (8 copies)/PcfJ-like protein
MLQDAAKRIEYTAKQATADAQDQWWIFKITEALVRATGHADLGDVLGAYDADEPPPAAWLADLVRPLGHTPFDPLIPWAFTQLRKKPGGGWQLANRLVSESPDLLAWYLAKKPNLGKFSLKEALDAANEYVATEAAKVVYEFPDGWTMRRLTTKRELEVEGDRMDHCVGGWEYCNKANTGTSIIYSLRDPAAEPYVTLEWLVKEAWFKQIYGPGDRPITDDVRPYVLEFIARVHGGAPRDMIMAGAPPRDVLEPGGRYHQITLVQADLEGADLKRIDLTEANLDEASLVGADLTDAILIRARLTEVDLTDAILIRANLVEAGLSGAILINADLRGADLRKAFLDGADMRGADLRGAKLIGANLTDAQLEDATMPDGSQFDAQARRHRA